MLRGGIDAYAVVPLVPALAAFAAGYQVGPIGPFLRLPLLWIGHRIVDGALFLAVGLLWIVHAAVTLVEFLVQVIAWPTLAILSAVRPKRERQADVAVA